MMETAGRILAELTFFSAAEGGRKIPPGPPWSRPGHAGYAPHVVVDGEEEYLGVRFESGPEPIAGAPALFELSLVHAHVDYSPLVPGAAISILEGGRVVARGVVRERPRS